MGVTDFENVYTEQRERELRERGGGAPETIPFTQGEPGLTQSVQRNSSALGMILLLPTQDLQFGQNCLSSLTEQSLETGWPENWITSPSLPGPNLHLKEQ